MSDPDDTTFTRYQGMKGADGRDVVLSNSAFQLHTFGVMNSIRDGHPGFISDDYLNAIAAETTLPAAELEAAGLWERVEGGYIVHDEQTMRFATEAYQWSLTLADDDDDDDDVPESS